MTNRVPRVPLAARPDSLYESYTPRWLYLTEFMDALGQADEFEKQEAVLLLIRDRLIYDGKIDERHFRFLTGKPSIVDAVWLATLSHESVDWQNSGIIAPGADNNAYPQWFLIEIASAGLSHFGSMKSAKKPRRARTSPEQARALKAMKALYGGIPPQDEVSNSVLNQEVNKYLKQEGLEPVKKDAIQRVAGRRI
jgi:hypothetical protein